MASKDVDENYYDDDDDDDVSDHSEPPHLKEHREEDDPKEQLSQPKTPTPLEATAKLCCFRLGISQPSDLKHLLESETDPNVPVEADFFSAAKYYDLCLYEACC